MQKKTQHTFWTLLRTYDKIEVPIIQRDYAQGRDNPDVERIRNKFINDYLINSLLQKKNIELDFVYGSILESGNGKARQELFIPLDGQQRLTTLFLLHWFIALKEERLEDARSSLSKFTYETRPSAHDFCGKLIEMQQPKDIRNIRNEIQDAEWYDDDWNNDPTITGMLIMIQTFADNAALMDYPHQLFDALLSEDAPLISFYFISLENFGLTENLYIRMNARGKMLTEFENFKSEFYKIISYSPELLEIVKDKIEYEWVDNLWNYKESESFIIDKPFMNYLNFLSEMLYFKTAKFRADDYESNFLDFRVLKDIYSGKENLEFLIFSLDKIHLIEKHKENLLWGNHTSIHDLFKDVTEGKRDVTKYFMLYSTLLFYYYKKEEADFYDYIRVVRNLVHNTADKSIREWPKLLKSLRYLITDDNVYITLLKDRINDKLDGFYVPQRKEEIVKAKIIRAFPEAGEIIFEVEDNPNLKGNIDALLIANFAFTYAGITDFEWSKIDIQTFSIKRLVSLYKSYQMVSTDDFESVWGDLLISPLYTHKMYWGRLVYDEDYAKHPAVILLALEYSKVHQGTSLEKFLEQRQKNFVRKLQSKVADLSTVRNVKEQLYLYYIIHIRLMNGSYSSFFKNGGNFGWLKKQTGFSSIFSNGVEHDPIFDEVNVNPVFQTYWSNFTFGLGLKANRALDEEVVSKGRKRYPFELLKKWANE